MSECSHYDNEKHWFEWGEGPRNVWNAFHPTCSKCGRSVGQIIMEDVPRMKAELERLRVEREAPCNDREFLGQLVRMVWIDWAKEQDDSKPSWLVPWDELPEPVREADRRIGEKVAEVSCALLTREMERLKAELAHTRPVNRPSGRFARREEGTDR